MPITSDMIAQPLVSGRRLYVIHSDVPLTKAQSDEMIAELKKHIGEDQAVYMPPGFKLSVFETP